MLKVICFVVGIFTGLAIGYDHCVESNRASLDRVIVVEKKPIRTVAELDAWAETARFGKLK